MVLVCPGLQKGQVRIEHYASKRTKFVLAHDSRIACFALTQDGSLLATASSKGTLVRIFNTVDGTLRQEVGANYYYIASALDPRCSFDSYNNDDVTVQVRRGADRAEIYSLAFSSNAEWLAVSSDKGTVHVFGLKVNSGVKDTPRIASNVTRPTSPSSSLSLFKGIEGLNKQKQLLSPPWFSKHNSFLIYVRSVAKVFQLGVVGGSVQVGGRNSVHSRLWSSEEHCCYSWHGWEVSN